MKRMNFNVGDLKKQSKCQKMHIGKKKQECYSLKARNKIMQDVSEISYLGDTVSNDARNTKYIKCRKSKGVGIIRKYSTF